MQLNPIPTIIFCGAACYVSFLFGHVYGSVENKIQEPPVIQDVIQPQPQKEVVPDLSMWQTIDYDGRLFFFTNYATPTFFDGCMTYIWNEHGCYAFDPAFFTLEEIYELVMRKSKKPKPEFGNDFKIQFSV